MKLKITDFAKRHFEVRSSGTKILSHGIGMVEEYINEGFEMLFAPDGVREIESDFESGIERVGYRLLDGYDDFCKLLVVDNFTDAKVGTTKITNENYQWLRSKYTIRADGELPVLTRSLHLPMPAEKADYLVFVLYKKDHLKKEYDDKNEERFKDHEARTGKVMTQDNRESLLSIDGLKFDLEEHEECEWGVVSIMGQGVRIEEPMTPATMIRNHLGTIYGGSGSDIKKEAYERSVIFWSQNALIR